MGIEFKNTMEAYNAAVGRVIAGAAKELPHTVVGIVGDEAYRQTPIKHVDGRDCRCVRRIGKGPWLSHCGSGEAA